MSLAGVLLAAGPASAASPTTRWVDADGQAGGKHACAGTRTAFTSIQAAIDASAPKDTVRVCPGTYHEAVVIETPKLTVEGVSGLKAKIVPPENDTTSAGFDQGAIRVTANRVTLRRLNVLIPDTCEYEYDGIQAMLASHVRVLDSRVAERGQGDGECGLSNGIVFNGASGEVARTTVQSYSRVGVYAYVGSNVSIHDNQVVLPQGPCPTAAPCASGGFLPIGIDVYQSGASVDHNAVSSDAAFGTSGISTAGVLVVESLASAGHAVTVTHNTTRGAWTGIYIQSSDGTVAWNDIRRGSGAGMVVYSSQNLNVRHNRVKSQGAGGIQLASDASSNVLSDNNFSGNAGTDCTDQNTGVPNTWSNNLGDESDPAGICTPAS